MQANNISEDFLFPASNSMRDKSQTLPRANQPESRPLNKDMQVGRRIAPTISVRVLQRRQANDAHRTLDAGLPATPPSPEHGVEPVTASVPDPERGRVVRLPKLIELIGLSRSSVYAAMSRGEFPKQVHIGRRAVGWRIRDIQQWLEARPKS